MRAYPDTSFLCSLYRTDGHSKKADAWMAKSAEPLPVSTLLLLEFRQSVRFQVRLNTQDRTKGYQKEQGAQMLRALQTDLSGNVMQIAPADWSDVHQIAERLSATHTETGGHRLADILHVATALHFGAADFLTFDANQKQLAVSEGLTVPW